jgi:hypothetical protein
MDVESTRDRFVREFVQRGPGSVGLETNIAGFVDARRRFFIAIQGWEKTPWMRPLLTRIEGVFVRSENNTFTTVEFFRRGLALPLSFLALLLPYTVARVLIDEWPPELFFLAIVALALLLVVAIGMVLTALERRIYKQLSNALLAAYDRPPVDDV